MASFNLNNYKALLRYSMVENKKNYLMAIGIGILAYTLIGIFFFNILPSAGQFVNYRGADMSGELEAMTLIATGIFAIVMTFSVTQFELVNRYCLQREAMQYNLLPASYKEKGWSILTMFFGYVMLVSIIYYLIAYIITFIYFLVFNAAVDFQPFCIFGEAIIEFVNSFPREVPNGVFFSLILFVCLAPLSGLANTLCYFVAVTYFKTKAQIKALAVLMVISNVLSWAFLLVGSVIGQFLDPIFEYFNNIDEQTALGYLYAFDAFLVIFTVALTFGFGYWFFRRLHYKEIR